jgi:hypothetical protein
MKSKELTLIEDCIKKVRKEYYSEPMTRAQDGGLVVLEKDRYNERAYTSQLLHLIQSTFESNNIHVDKLYQTDQPKQLIFSKQETAEKYDHTFSKLFFKDEKEFFRVPDIVIHSGAEDFNEKNQIFLSEVKTTPTLSQLKFDIDLFKVNLYHEELKFQNSVFLIVNKSLVSVRRMLRAYTKRKYFLSKREGAYILVKPSYKAGLETINLNELKSSKR